MSDQNPLRAHETPGNPVQGEHIQAEPAQAPGGKSGGLTFAHLVLVVMLALFLWQWFDSHRMLIAMQRQLAEMEGNSKAGKILLAQSQEQVRTLSDRIAILESQFADTQNQRAALEALYNNLSAGREETLLAEIEQLLLTADQQLRLSGNVKGALLAMQNADERLQHMSRPAFTSLRRTIEGDMGRLRTFPEVDVSAINSSLNGLIDGVDTLPLEYQRQVADEPAGHAAPSAGETFWQRLKREIWQGFRQLVRIENTGRPEIPLLSPDQAFFLRENLKLRLLSARMALLSHDESSFHDELNTTSEWTARYFDLKSAAGVRMTGQLQKLGATPITVKLPDIEASLQAVRNYRLSSASHDPRPASQGEHKAAQ